MKKTTIEHLLRDAPFVLVPVANEPGSWWSVFPDGSRVRDWIPGRVAPELAAA